MLQHWGRSTSGGPHCLTGGQGTVQGPALVKVLEQVLVQALALVKVLGKVLEKVPERALVQGQVLVKALEQVLVQVWVPPLVVLPALIGPQTHPTQEHLCSEEQEVCVYGVLSCTLQGYSQCVQSCTHHPCTHITHVHTSPMHTSPMYTHLHSQVMLIHSHYPQPAPVPPPGHLEHSQVQSLVL